MTATDLLNTPKLPNTCLVMFAEVVHCYLVAALDSGLLLFTIIGCCAVVATALAVK